MVDQTSFLSGLSGLMSGLMSGLCTGCVRAVYGLMQDIEYNIRATTSVTAVFRDVRAVRAVYGLMCDLAANPYHCSILVIAQSF